MQRILYTPLSREFLLNRGCCCKSGCENCPYNYKKEIMKEDHKNTIPTQAEIIEHNRKHCRDFIGLSNYTEKMTLVPENLLEKLKDFNYWKEWKSK